MNNSDKWRERLAQDDVQVDPETGLIIPVPPVVPKVSHRPVHEAMLAITIALCVVGGAVAFTWLFVVLAVGPNLVARATATPTSTQVVITRTPVPTWTPTPVRSPTPARPPVMLFSGEAITWEPDSPQFDASVAVFGTATGKRIYVCWTGTGESVHNSYERIISLQPKCALGINDAERSDLSAAVPLGVSNDIMRVLGMDVTLWDSPRLMIFSVEGGVPSDWPIVDQ